MIKYHGGNYTIETKLTATAASILLSFLIDRLLLGKNVPFLVPKSLDGKYRAGAYQHNIAGSGFPEVVVETKDEQ